MEQGSTHPILKLTRKLNLPSNNIVLFISVLVIALVAGVGTGYALSATGNNGNVGSALTQQTPKVPQQDNKTFRDFAEGKITKKPDPKKNEAYLEGTHLLVRENSVPVALTSSVVDLSQYEGKKVKVYGETQKAVKEGWLMDVGRVEEIK